MEREVSQAFCRTGIEGKYQFGEFGGFQPSLGICSGGSCTGSVAGFQKEVVVANTMRAHPTKDRNDPEHLFSSAVERPHRPV